jgi:antitoxin MazE
MRTELVSIGNSRGIRIPKPFIEQCGLDKVVELVATSEGLVITPHHSARHGWREAFATAASSKGEKLLLDRIRPNAFDSREWEW